MYLLGIQLPKKTCKDRCKVLLAKMCFNIPEQPKNASKLYYIEEVTNCLKITCSEYVSETTFQSIDEYMAKFKCRISLKQYLPMKAIKHGIKIKILLLRMCII